MCGRRRTDSIREVIQASRWFYHCISSIAALLVLNASACTWISTPPIHYVPTRSERVAAEFLEIPEKGCPGELVTFVMQTSPGNQCEARLLYQAENKEINQVLTTSADSEGICSWFWNIPNDVSPGYASVYIAVQYDDRESTGLPPVGFPITPCDEVPEEAHPGEQIRFTVRAPPGNQCKAHLFYRVEDKQDFEILVTAADQDGICSWLWEIPANASAGYVGGYAIVGSGKQESQLRPLKGIQVVQCSE